MGLEINPAQTQKALESEQMIAKKIRGWARKRADDAAR